jgi:hypothetical protein
MKQAGESSPTVQAREFVPECLDEEREVLNSDEEEAEASKMVAASDVY